MKNRTIAFVLGVAALVIPALVVPSPSTLAFAQAPAASPLLLPPQVEKGLAAKASVG